MAGRYDTVVVLSRDGDGGGGGRAPSAASGAQDAHALMQDVAARLADGGGGGGGGDAVLLRRLQQALQRGTADPVQSAHKHRDARAAPHGRPSGAAAYDYTPVASGAGVSPARVAPPVSPARIASRPPPPQQRIEVVRSLPRRRSDAASASQQAPPLSQTWSTTDDPQDRSTRHLVARDEHESGGDRGVPSSGRLSPRAPRAPHGAAAYAAALDEVQGPASPPPSHSLTGGWRIVPPLSGPEAPPAPGTLPTPQRDYYDYGGPLHRREDTVLVMRPPRAPHHPPPTDDTQHAASPPRPRGSLKYGNMRGSAFDRNVSGGAAGKEGMQSPRRGVGGGGLDGPYPYTRPHPHHHSTTHVGHPLAAVPPQPLGARKVHEELVDALDPAAQEKLFWALAAKLDRADGRSVPAPAPTSALLAARGASPSATLPAPAPGSAPRQRSGSPQHTHDGRVGIGVAALDVATIPSAHTPSGSPTAAGAVLGASGHHMGGIETPPAVRNDAAYGGGAPRGVRAHAAPPAAIPAARSAVLDDHPQLGDLLAAAHAAAKPDTPAVPTAVAVPRDPASEVARFDQQATAVQTVVDGLWGRLRGTEDRGQPQYHHLHAPTAALAPVPAPAATVHAQHPYPHPSAPAHGSANHSAPPGVSTITALDTLASIEVQLQHLNARMRRQGHDPPHAPTPAYPPQPNTALAHPVAVYSTTDGAPGTTLM